MRKTMALFLALSGLLTAGGDVYKRQVFLLTDMDETLPFWMDCILFSIIVGNGEKIK